VGSYDAYAVPRRAYITKVEQQNGRVRLFGDAESVVKFQRDYRIVRAPLQSVDPLKRTILECRYVVVDDAGRVVLADHAPLAGDSSFHLDLGSRLRSGHFTLLAQIIVNANAMNADIQQVHVFISSNP
jgi:hypothetical protein